MQSKIINSRNDRAILCMYKQTHPEFICMYEVVLSQHIGWVGGGGWVYNIDGASVMPGHKKYSGIGFLVGSPRTSFGAASNIGYFLSRCSSSSNIAATFPHL